MEQETIYILISILLIILAALFIFWKFDIEVEEEDI